MYLSRFKKFYFHTLPLLFVGFGSLLIILALGPLVVSEVWFGIKELRGNEYVLDLDDSESAFASQLTDTPAAGAKESILNFILGKKKVKIQPVNTDFSIVIERLNVAAPIVKDVTVFDETAYTDALKQGIAHAASSDYPSTDPSNVYLFAHSSLNFLHLGEYATVFNLLRKLDAGDKIHIFYKGAGYVYEVIGKDVYKGWDTRPLSRLYVEPILTLQTCDPPGTTLNRLVVTAKLVEVVD